MRIENTDRFRNKICKVIFKTGAEITGRVFMIPNFSEKHGYHDVGWFVYPPGAKNDVQLNFKDIADIVPLEEGDNT